MEYINKFAKEFIRTHIRDNIGKYDEIINSAKEKLVDIDNALDKTQFLTIILTENNRMNEEHLKVCRNLENCRENYCYESISYFLNQELNRLGIKTDDNFFTKQETDAINDKLNQILRDLDEVKLGHTIIYDGLLEEIQGLKDLYFLGKKNWYQLLLGKCFEMTASGIISETISKEIVQQLMELKKTLAALS